MDVVRAQTSARNREQVPSRQRRPTPHWKLKLHAACSSAAGAQRRVPSVSGKQIVPAGHSRLLPLSVSPHSPAWLSSRERSQSPDCSLHHRSTAHPPSSGEPQGSATRCDFRHCPPWQLSPTLHGVEAAEGADGQVFGQGTAEFTGRLAGTADGFSPLT